MVAAKFQMATKQAQGGRYAGLHPKGFVSYLFPHGCSTLW